MGTELVKFPSRGRGLTRLAAFHTGLPARIHGHGALRLHRLRLGLAGNPTAEEVRRAYKLAALRWHPDRQQNHNCAEEAKKRFQEVRAAFELLQPPVRAHAA